MVARAVELGLRAVLGQAGQDAEVALQPRERR